MIRITRVGSRPFLLSLLTYHEIWPPEMKRYPEVPQWWYLLLFVLSLGVGIGCSVSSDPLFSPSSDVELCITVYNQ